MSGWQGGGHWLGSSYMRTKLFLPFSEALAVARALRLNTAKEWRAWCKSGARPANVPAAPDTFYRDHGWQGWGHWLQHTRTSDKDPASPVTSRESEARHKRAPPPATSCGGSGKRRRR